jgi:anti-sigma regulatory factor (Ser/Thr protein kinase)
MQMAAEVGAPRAARSFVTHHLADRVLPAGVLIGDVVLVVSELVTNAVEAGASNLGLTLALNLRGLELVVEDDAGGWPLRTVVGADAARGRGLNIVEQLADSWHVTGTPGGKRVTAWWAQPAT